jgi:hypothetical protein
LFFLPSVRASHHRATRENARGSVSSSISRSRGSLERVDEIMSRKVRGLARRARGRVAGALEAQARVRRQSRLERWHAVVVCARVAFPGPSLAPWREKRNAFLSRNKPSGDTRRAFGGARVPGASRPDADARPTRFPFRTAPRSSADARAAVWVTAKPPPGLASRRDVSRQTGPTH